MIDSLLAALIAIIGSILGAVGVKLYERFSPADQRKVWVDSMSFRIRGSDYNEITALPTNQDSYFTTYAILNTSDKFVTDQAIYFDVYQDNRYSLEDSPIRSGPHVSIDADALSATEVALEVDGHNGKIVINSLTPKTAFYLFVAASFRHFVVFRGANDNLSINHQTFWKLSEIRRSLAMSRLTVWMAIALMLILVAQIVYRSLYG